MTRGISGSEGGNHISYSDSTVFKAKGEKPQIDGVSIWDNDQLTETTTYENGKKVSYQKTLSRKEHVVQFGDEIRTKELVNERYDSEGNVINTTVDTKRNGNIIETTTYENGKKVSYKKEEETKYHVTKGGDDTYRKVLVNERYDSEGNVINTTTDTKVTNLHVKKAK